MRGNVRPRPQLILADRLVSRSAPQRRHVLLGRILDDRCRRADTRFHRTLLVLVISSAPQEVRGRLSAVIAEMRRISVRDLPKDPLFSN
jgi:hypothetical protein